MNRKNLWGGRALSSSGNLRAAVSCAWSFILLACADAEPHARVVVPPEPPDSGSTSSNEVFPDGGEPARAQVCVVTEDYVAEHKACKADADCTVFEYQPTCCSEVNAVGITLNDLKAAQACSDAMDAACSCPKDFTTLTRTEDGRAVTESSPATVQCIDSQCVSRVSQRQCGASHNCNPGEICVTYENVPGGFPPDPDSRDNALLTFRCEPNPCSSGDGKLACDCAKLLCDARNDVERMCEIKHNAEADLTCSAYHD
ncbi:MAG TPA: hypothetical protein VFN67_15900 [Polyangiales bacterium]|nr:hypothetical protein [Polyangiales bacterium]